MASDEAELKIKLISRRIETKADAFLYGMLETIGKVTGFAISITLILMILRLFGFEIPSSEETT